jgi:AcrR family transcriptional regulator
LPIFDRHAENPRTIHLKGASLLSNRSALGLPQKMSMARKRTAAGRPRDPEKDAAILGAAARIIRERGYRGLSMEAVAAKAGVGKQSIYRRCSSKSGLLVDLYMNGLYEIDYRKNSKFPQAFSNYILDTVARAASPILGKVLLGLSIEALSSPEARREFVGRIITPRRNTGRQLLLWGIEEGYVRKDIDIEMALDMAVGPVWFNLIVIKRQPVAKFHKRLVAAVFRYCLKRPEIVKS